ncbi:putative aminotransferase [Scytonema sp. HK-05]|uniref:pyridoxal phosphate-dependent aminotransferase n=1 Tax=Scytonema sp. HK-05 TaxID=1137095 RepID=UPI0009379AB7|nr:aminotransferase class I/II-fold pyridoxal phosphate-dependent enzyme [Scytonema sp. HK-05]OKH58839.1 aminotransferase [Scytonema sp. HK-05]BAY48168.1 putative aminotransferase [Scytonema sp. HK-05]
MYPSAERLHHFRTSVIREMTRLAIKHKAVNMAQGLPDFPASPELIRAACQAMEEGHNQYTNTWGIPELRQAISSNLQNLYDLYYDPEEQITVTCGVSEGIVLAMLSLVNPGDEVIVIEPFHDNYLPAINFAQAKPVFVRLEPPFFQLDPERLRAAFSDKTKAIVINTPHNPTGRVFTREELNHVASLCREFNVVAITDEIYDRITYDEHQHIPLATLDGMFEQTITISGMSKTFAVTGWRLGYVCAPSNLSAAVRTLHDFTTICAPAPFQYAAVAALGLPESFFKTQKEAYTIRRDRILKILEKHEFLVQPPQGAYYLITDFSQLDFYGDDEKFAKYLVEEVGIAVVPGSSFYSTPEVGRNTVRWSFAKKMETFDAVEQRLQTLKKYSLK